MVLKEDSDNDRVHQALIILVWMFVSNILEV